MWDWTWGFRVEGSHRTIQVISSEQLHDGTVSEQLNKTLPDTNSPSTVKSYVTPESHFIMFGVLDLIPHWHFHDPPHRKCKYSIFPINISQPHSCMSS